METVTYSQIGSLSIQFDLYTPSPLSPGPIPALIFFHGGGMVAGCRKTLDFQGWLKDAALHHPMLFISADHRLLHPSTGATIIADVKALFTFLSSPSFSRTHLPPHTTLDTTRLAVCGESGGGYAAFAAGIYGVPKPRVVFLQYAMGGELLSDHWVAVKEGPPAWKAPGVPEVGREELRELFGEGLEEIAFDPIIIPVLKQGGGGVGPTATQVSQRRELLTLFWREGMLLDYIVGRAGISAELRRVPFEERMGRVPEELRPVVVQGLLGAGFPATVFVHGTGDLLVDMEESTRPCERLREAGVKVEMIKVEGAGHALLDPANMPYLKAGAREAQEKAWRFVVGELLG